MNQQITTDDYYKILECNPEANPKTIEFLFRYFVKLAESSENPTTKANRISVLTQAYEVLRDPHQRADYDQQRQMATEKAQALFDSQSESVKVTGTEVEAEFEMPTPEENRQNRLKTLQILLQRRRKDARHPGLAPSSIAQKTGLSEQETDFQIWYLVQKGWVQREESGVVSIAATGVDQCAAILND